MAKKQAVRSLSLFEATQPEAVAAAEPQAPPPKIKDACPQCGGRSLKTVRSFEHNGHTHYCATACLSEDRTDAFYFTPKEETFDEQAERETVKKDKSLAQSAAKPVAVVEPLVVFDEVVQVEETEEEAPVEITTEQVNAEQQAVDLFGVPIEKPRAGALAERFLVPPFSVLDARQGYWTARKREWIAMGITSEGGRGENRMGLAPAERAMPDYKKPKGLLNASTEYEWGEEYEGGNAWAGSGTSIFDPVLCELSYLWFAPQGGKILDPFAGGSVRGIVAEKIGYHYTGIELRREQIDANLQQAEKIGVQPTWILGDSHKLNELLPEVPYEERYDMLFTCPPYYDLEQYSESNADGSAKQTYAEFLRWYEEIFKQCVARLKWNRFAVVVVGEIRDDSGWYRNFVGDTVEVLRRCGLRYYNEAILVTAVGSLPLRVNTQFGGYRKLGKTHQNVLVFYNGTNCDQIEEKFGKLL